MKKLIVAAGLAAVASSLPTFALAQAKPAASPHTFTGNVGFVSEYRYRGISQTDGKPALQGGFDYAHTSGVYLGTWASNVSWLSDTGLAKSSLEWDFYGGFKGAAGDFGYDFGVLQYYYPGNFDTWKAAGNASPNTTELYAAGTWKMLTLKYSHAVTDILRLPGQQGLGLPRPDRQLRHRQRHHAGRPLRLPEDQDRARRRRLLVHRLETGRDQGPGRPELGPGLHRHRRQGQPLLHERTAARTSARAPSSCRSPRPSDGAPANGRPSRGPAEPEIQR